MNARQPLRFARCLVLASAFGAIATAAFAQAPGRFTGLQVGGDQPIAIESDQLDVDDAKAVATFTGNVEVAQGPTMMKSAKLVVYYVKAAADDKTGAKPAPAKGAAMPGGNNQIDRLEASGKVYIKSDDQVATSETANFDMKSQIAVLVGDVVLTQGENIARGPKLTIHMDTGIAQFSSDGKARIKMLMAPQAEPPKP